MVTLPVKLMAKQQCISQFVKKLLYAYYTTTQTLLVTIDLKVASNNTQISA